MWATRHCGAGPHGQVGERKRMGFLHQGRQGVIRGERARSKPQGNSLGTRLQDLLQSSRAVDKVSWWQPWQLDWRTKASEKLGRTLGFQQPWTQWLHQGQAGKCHGKKISPGAEVRVASRFLSLFGTPSWFLPVGHTRSDRVGVYRTFLPVGLLALLLWW